MTNFLKETADLFENSLLGVLLLFHDTQIQNNRKEDSFGFSK